jgi:hypothetical protein
VEKTNGYFVYVSANTSRKVVYFDEAYPTSWVAETAARELKDYLVGNGFDAKNASELKIWMEWAIENVVETVVVFSMDVVPDCVVESMSPSATLRKSLDAGGRVIWLGDVPCWYRGYPNGTTERWGEEGAINVLGFHAGDGEWNVNDTVNLTSLGGRWGLTCRWNSLRPVKPRNITRVLALNCVNESSSWLKNYNLSLPTSGFLRIWDKYINALSYSEKADVYNLTILGDNEDYVARYQD